MKRCISKLLLLAMAVTLLTGCGSTKVNDGNKTMQENVVLTETGEVLVKEQPTAEPEKTKEPEKVNDISLEEQVHVQKEHISIGDVEIDVPLAQEEIVEQEPVEATGNDLQIVFLGDSIFDSHRDGTGIPYLTAVQCEADVYNLAIGGTSATVEVGEQIESEKWESRSLVGVVKALKGEITTDIFKNYNAKRVLDDPNADFSKTDYFVVEYGINDFFQAAPLDNLDATYDFTTYVGALRYAVTNLREIAPDATIILCSPHYCQFFDGNRYIGDSNILNNGYGTLFDYKGKCLYVAKEQQTESLDAYFDLGIDGYTAKQYLEDGIHLTAEGRQLYADTLAKKILKLEETKNN
ncbi:MAG: SGNH/GDSL hydrolase family protein [Lachnospiraceae bacterium]|nr:SGNH/GDSL hydrolase family protein [Lachnospiraceae bacterium]